MAGYTRQDGGNISNGNIIDATDLNAEFDKLQTAFASSGGHTHDGTSDGGARIEVVGPNGEVTVGASAVTPKVSTDVDVGTASLKFNNANFKGTVSAPTFTATSGATIPSLTVGSSTAVTSVDADLSSVSTNHDTLASAKAIKTYIDSQVTAQDLDITDGTTTGSIDLDSQSLTFTGSTGITASVSNQTVTISTDDSAISHDSLSGFVAAEHVDHSAVSITAGNGLTGGGTIASTRTLTVDPHTGIAVTTDGVALSHLGLEDLADPDADRVAFWDDSEGAFKWLEMGSNLAITDTTLNATNTTYSAGTGLTLSGTTFNANVDATEQTTAAETVTSTANRTYAVQVDASDNLVVNVPWVDTDTDTDTTYAAGTGLTLDGTTFNANVDATTQTVASETVSATASRTYAVQVDSSDNLVVNVPWTSPSTLTSSGVVNITPTTDEASSNTQPTVVIKSALTPSNDSREPNLILLNTDTIPTANDTIGSIKFRAENANDEAIDYVSVTSAITDTTDGSEDGSLKFNVMAQGTSRNIMEIKHEGSRNKVFFKNDGHFGEAQLVFYNDNTPLTSTKPGLISFGDSYNDYAYATIEGNVTDTGVGTEAGGLVMKVMDYFDQELDEVFTARQASSSTNDEGGTAIRHKNSFVRVFGGTINLCPNSYPNLYSQYIKLGQFLNTEARFAIETDKDVVLETTQNGGDLYLGSQDSSGPTGDIKYVVWSGDETALKPGENDLYDLGTNTSKWDDIYATNGTIQTSDVNAKQDIEAISEAETRVAQALKGLLRKYRWISAVEEKGDAARYHFGIIAQDVKQAFEDEGLDPFKYAMLTKTTTWTEEYTVVEQPADPDNGIEQVLKTKQRTYTTAEEAPEGATEITTWGVRYPELLAFIIAGL